jgi:hypothetical protein
MIPLSTTGRDLGTHTACIDPTAPTDALPRESMGLRT